MKDNFFFCGKVGHSGAADVERQSTKRKKKFKKENKKLQSQVQITAHINSDGLNRNNCAALVR